MSSLDILRGKGIFIYVIAPIIRGETGPTKVGIAQDPSARLRQLQSGSPVPLEVFVSYWCPDRAKAGALERNIHQRFSPHRLHGEWFAISPEVAAETINLSLQVILLCIDGISGSAASGVAEFCGLHDLGGGRTLPADFYTGMVREAASWQ